MGPHGIGDVTARIATIERRFTPPPQVFQAALRTAAATPAAGRFGQPATGSAGGGPAGARALAGAGDLGGTGATGRAAATPRPSGGAVGAWATGLPPAGRAWAADIERAALRAGVDPALLASLVWAESGFQPGAVSHAGAIGLAQLMPATAAGLGVDPHDPQQNLDGGARFLRAMLDKFGTPTLALAAYNAGPGRVAEAGGIPNITETRAYVPKVLGYYDQIRGAA